MQPGLLTSDFYNLFVSMSVMSVAMKTSLIVTKVVIHKFTRISRPYRVPKISSSCRELACFAPKSVCFARIFILLLILNITTIPSINGFHPGAKFFLSHPGGKMFVLPLEYEKFRTSICSENTQNCFAHNSATKYRSEAVLYSKRTA